jgi:hypothetical protein
VNAFHFFGASLAIWALVVSFLGITREGFPGSPQAARTVGAISVILALLAIGTAIYTGATEEDEQPEGQGEGALLRPI